MLLIAVTLLLAYRLWESRSLDRRGVARRRDRAERAHPARSGVPRPVPRDPVPVLPEPRAVRSAARHRLVIGALCLVVILPWWVRNLTQFHEPDLPRHRQRGGAPGVELRRHVLRPVPRLLGHHLPDRRRAASECAAGADPARHQRARPRLSPSRATRATTRNSTPTRAEKAFDYIGDHLSRVPIVVAARVGSHLGRLPGRARRELRHLLRTAREVAVVGRRVHVLRAAAVRGLRARWSCAGGGSRSRR